MAAKRNEESNQPELPNRGPKAEGTEGGNGPASPSANGGSNGASNGTGDTHVHAEAVPEEVIHHRPFVPSARELELHKRVDTNFLQYASYVIRDRAIPNIE